MNNISFGEGTNLCHSCHEWHSFVKTQIDKKTIIFIWQKDIVEIFGLS
jgi:hypothetical protein